ncbi:hypothetical protein [Parasitella parasitica]|uniref:Uncharacterized protein n=1 Tax=Parasitella parasitica TaxID=35722 RepID=A0A0B7NLF1_9FUNG|nr:hypothetical protein [Parasitella parasitica]
MLYPSGGACEFTPSHERFGISRLSRSFLTAYEMKEHSIEYHNDQRFPNTIREKLSICGNSSISTIPKKKSVFGNMQYRYVAYMQGTALAISPVHTAEEVEVYGQLRKKKKSLQRISAMEVTGSGLCYLVKAFA